MPSELKIPEVGESITEVQISEWLKSEGDTVKQDEGVAVIDSEKATFELPAPMGGRLTKILHKAGDTVRVGEVIAHIESEGKTVKPKPAEEQTDARSKPESNRPDGSKAQSTTQKATDETRPAGKPAMEREDVREKPEEERDGRKESTPAEGRRENRGPARQAATKVPEPNPPTSAKPATGVPSIGREEEIVPMTMLRRTVARRLVEARQTMALLTTFNEVDMSAVQALRTEHQEAFAARYQVKLGLLSFFVKAAIDGLKQFPQLNARIQDDDIVYHNYFDIGVAMATERGLVVPVLRHAERLSFSELEKVIGDFAQRARDGKLKPEELDGGTFTITNGGVFGSLLSTPIINPPQTGILGLHTIQERPVAREGQVVIRPMMYVALTYDHRIVDGREAVLYLRRVKEVIETPALMLIEV